MWRTFNVQPIHAEMQSVRLLEITQANLAKGKPINYKDFFQQQVENKWFGWSLKL